MNISISKIFGLWMFVFFTLSVFSVIVSADTAIFTPTAGTDRSYSEHGWQEYKNKPLTQDDLDAVAESDDNWMQSAYQWAPWVYYEYDYIEFLFDIDVSDIDEIEDVVILIKWKGNALMNDTVRTNIHVWNNGGWLPFYEITVPDPDTEIYQEISVFDEINTLEELENLRLRFKTATAWDVDPWAYTYHDYVAVKVVYTENGDDDDEDGGEGGGRVRVIGCEEIWQCGEWSSCLNGMQFRTCGDINSCGTFDFQPDEVRSCFMPTGTGVVIVNEPVGTGTVTVTGENDNKQGLFGITGLAIGAGASDALLIGFYAFIILLAILLIIFLIVRLRKF